MQSTSTTSDSTKPKLSPYPKQEPSGILMAEILEKYNEHLSAEKEPFHVFRALFHVTWANNANPIVQFQDFEKPPTQKKIRAVEEQLEYLNGNVGWKVDHVNHFATIKHYLPSDAAAKAELLEQDADWETE